MPSTVNVSLSVEQVAYVIDCVRSNPNDDPSYSTDIIAALQTALSQSQQDDGSDDDDGDDTASAADAGDDSQDGDSCSIDDDGNSDASDQSDDDGRVGL